MKWKVSYQRDKETYIEPEYKFKLLIRLTATSDGIGYKEFMKLQYAVRVSVKAGEHIVHYFL